jgi:transketolase
MNTQESCIGAIAEVLVSEGTKRDNIYVLSADLGPSCGLSSFKKNFPERYFEFGSAEQNMVSAAAGMSTCGIIPIAASYGIFLTGRAWEQIRNLVALGNFNVKLLGTHTGLYNAHDGASHVAVEDIALCRSIPGLTIISPGDAYETKEAILWALSNPGPVYLRVWGGKPIPVVPHIKNEIDLHSGFKVFDCKSKQPLISFISTGTVTVRVIEAAKQLTSKGYFSNVFHFPFVNPINKKKVLEILKNTSYVFTVEEHSIRGGVGSIVAEIIAEVNANVLMYRIGVSDWTSPGSYENIIGKIGLSIEKIVKTAINYIESDKR